MSDVLIYMIGLVRWGTGVRLSLPIARLIHDLSQWYASLYGWYLATAFHIEIIIIYGKKFENVCGTWVVSSKIRACFFPRTSDTYVAVGFWRLLICLKACFDWGTIYVTAKRKEKRKATERTFSYLLKPRCRTQYPDGCAKERNRMKWDHVMKQRRKEG